MKVTMSLQTRKELLAGIRERYKKASWKEKGRILDGFITTTNYRRKYAISLINNSQPSKNSNKERNKEKEYNEAVHQALVTVWCAANQICSKRLVPFLPDFVEALERFGHLSLPKNIRKRLLKISAATVDRLLKPERQSERKSLCTTRVGNFLKRQIRIRTFTDWDDVVPGFFEGDLVVHCGDNVEGSFLNTFVLTDIASQWTEFLALLRRGRGDVIDALQATQEVLPFPFLGLDTDNGSEFINYVRWSLSSRQIFHKIKI